MFQGFGGIKNVVTAEKIAILSTQHSALSTLLYRQTRQVCHNVESMVRLFY
ncbi:hypothetical protein [Argonema antarcticum]|uniref:hypothetical protein n=1 Tax=Argonema antarcticum TaxID=2942763 RepID=UPI002010F7EA|nr:hypothetical protein [Argonema antarcticum]MCL1474663.1 hypothetical protein [Argonema antarcticum A004/B2]